MTIFDAEFLAMFDVEEEKEVKVIEKPTGTQTCWSYGPLKKGKYYNIIEEDMDWCAVRLEGRKIFIPNWVFSIKSMVLLKQKLVSKTNV